MLCLDLTPRKVQTSVVDDDTLDMVSARICPWCVRCDMLVEQASSEEQRESAAASIVKG